MYSKWVCFVLEVARWTISKDKWFSDGHTQELDLLQRLNTQMYLYEEKVQYFCEYSVFHQKFPAIDQIPHSVNIQQILLSVNATFFPSSASYLEILE